MNTNSPSSAENNNQSLVELSEFSHLDENEERKLAIEVAAEILNGFDKHYRLFRACARQAKHFFEQGDWQALQKLARERIDYYDHRVSETVIWLQNNYSKSLVSESIWSKIKTRFVTYLVNHQQPELAETFFNSVTTKLLHRHYYNNSFMFVRPAVSTEYLESNPPTYRSYYLNNELKKVSFKKVLYEIIADFELHKPFENLERDIRNVARTARRAISKPIKIDQDCQIQVLSSLFFRNKGAYIIGKFVNGNMPMPFAVPILQKENGTLFIDTVLFTVQQIATLFSFTRAYFLVDMQIPSAFVQFLRSLLPNKPKAEMYTMLGLQKQGKTLFYRDFLYHLSHSRDQLVIARGIEGLVMAVFTLPSYPYVFKLIKDKIPDCKQIDRQGVIEKYQLVKAHDRVGRMADTWEYSYVSFPKKRFSKALLDHLMQSCPKSLSIEGNKVLIKHLYIERRMTPLNLYLQDVKGSKLEQIIIEYGNAIKQLASANIFPGDMLYKNFGVTRLGRVVFYDYDEIEYMTKINVRRIPPPRTPEDEFSDQPWYAVGPYDVFPEQFGRFLMSSSAVKQALEKHHSDIFTYEFWQEKQNLVKEGRIEDIFPYSTEIRFLNRYPEAK